MRLFVALAALLLSAPGTPVLAAAAPPATLAQTATRMAAHQASYVLTLDRVRGSEIVGAVSGTLTAATLTPMLGKNPVRRRLAFA